MNQLLKFWLEKNYHLNKKDAEGFGIDLFFLQLHEIAEADIPINQEIRHDLGETEFRYWLQDEWREANR